MLSDKRSTERIPSLDGLRAISVLLVLLEHATRHVTASTKTEGVILALCANGSMGVSIFFVISGYLITKLLILERASTGRISLLSFYLRRSFRIIPAFAVFLTTVTLLIFCGWIRMNPAELIWPATFTSDYHFGLSWFIVHTWSLSVEEQFYLVWPLILIFASRRILVWISCGVIVTEPMIRLFTYVLQKEHNTISIMAHTRADMLMFGCFIACLSTSHRFHKQILSSIEKSTLVACALVVMFVVSPLLTEYFRGAYLYSIGYTISGLCISVVLMRVVFMADSRLGRLLNTATVSYVGRLSYSLYLWQELFLGLRKLSVTQTVVSLGYASLVAVISYHAVEIPFIKLRRSLLS